MHILETYEGKMARIELKKRIFLGGELHSFSVCDLLVLSGGGLEVEANEGTCG